MDGAFDSQLKPMGGFLVFGTDKEIGRHRVGDQQIRLNYQIRIVLQFQVVKHFAYAPGKTLEAFITQHSEQYFVSGVSDHRNTVGFKHRCVWPVGALANPNLTVSQVIQSLDSRKPGQEFRHDHANPKTEQPAIDRKRYGGQGLLPFCGGSDIGDVN